MNVDRASAEHARFHRAMAHFMLHEGISVPNGSVFRFGEPVTDLNFANFVKM